MSPRRFIMLVLPAVVMLTAATPPPASEPVSAIRLNQFGFLPDSGKRAVMADASKSPLPWRVVDPSGNTIIFQQRRTPTGERSGRHRAVPTRPR